MKQKQVNWTQAENHAKSLLIGKPKDKNHDIHNGSNHCQCCGHEIEKQPLSLCQNTKELEFIGVGFPLYFIFFKYVIMLMLIECFAVSLIEISNAIDQNYNFCINNVAKIIPNLIEESKCTSYFILIASTQEYLSRIYVLLRASYFFIAFFFMIYMRDTLTKMIGYYDERSTTFSDYSLIIKHVPQKMHIKKDLKKMFQNYQICRIIVIGQFQHIEKMQRDIERKEKQASNVVQKLKKQGNESLALIKGQNYDEQLQKMREVLIQIVKNEQKLYENDEIIPQKIILCMQTDEQKQQLLNNINKKEGFLLPEHWTQEDLQHITASQAPQPKQIIWQNLNAPTKTRVKRQMIGWGTTILILTILSVIFYFGLLQLSIMIESEAEQNHNIARGLFYFSLILVTFINKFLICPLLQKICHYQMYFTKSKQQYGFTLKYLLSMFFTTALMTVFVQVITKKNIYTHQFGVIQSQSIMIIVSSFLIPLIWLVNPWTLALQVRRWLARERSNMTQDQANHLMEAVPYQMGKRYAEVVKLVWLVSLYQSLIPAGTVLATAGLALYYWVDKYNLLRRSSVKEAVSGFLTLRVMTLLEFSLLLKCAGQLLFDNYIRYEYSAISIIFLIISSIYMILPRNALLNLIHPQKFIHEQSKFTDCMDKLGNSYEDLHPVTGKKISKMLKSFVSSQFDERQFDSNNPLTGRSILNRSIVQQTSKVNIQLKEWKKQILASNFFNNEYLLQQQNTDIYNI